MLKVIIGSSETLLVYPKSTVNNGVAPKIIRTCKAKIPYIISIRYT